MITFYRRQSCRGCAAVQETLEELSLAHRVVLVGEDAKPPEGTKPPVLVDDEEVIQGRDNILAHLEELKDFKAQWDKFQTDACYCDEEGNVE
jgi:glutaredoxin